MGGEQALKLVAAVKEPAEVTGEGDEKGDDDDPRKLQGKFQVTAGDHDHHATDDEENEMAEHHSAGFAVGLNEDVELGGASPPPPRPEPTWYALPPEAIAPTMCERWCA